MERWYEIQRLDGEVVYRTASRDAVIKEWNRLKERPLFIFYYTKQEVDWGL